MMNRPSFSMPPAALPETDASAPPPSRRPAPLWQLWKTWLWLTGPRPQRFGADVIGREQLRRSRLISILLIVILVGAVLVISGSFALPQLWQTALVLIGFGVLAALLNRTGQVTPSGLVCVILVDASVIEYILMRSFNGDLQNPGLTPTTVSTFHLLSLGILMAGMFLPPRLIPIIGVLQVAIILGMFYGLPYSALLRLEIQQHNSGQGFLVIQGPIISQVCGAGIVWLYAWSVEQAILRASRAEELAAARAQIEQQARQITEQKERLEQGILALQDAQARVANGEYSARVSLQDNELLPLAVSFNIMAERLSHVAQIEQEHHRLESALQHVLEAVSALARGAAPTTLRASGTLVDRIFPLLTRTRQQMNHLLQGSGFAEDLRAILQRQQEQLAQAEAQLMSSLTLAKEMKEQAAMAPPPLRRDPLSSSFPGSGPLDPRTAEQRGAEQAAFLSNLSISLIQQITLLERAGKDCAQAHELGQHCIHGARILSQRLKEAA